AGLARAAATQGPMQIVLEGTGVFPNAAQPNVVWAGVAGDLQALKRLQIAVEREAEVLGFKPENRDYRPHLTLGRVNDGVAPIEVQRLVAAVGQAGGAQFGSFWPQRLSLMNSELRPGGSIYRQLFSTPLGATEPAA